MMKPARLHAGARVALVAPAGPVTEERIARSVQCCARLGLEAVVGPNATLQHGYLAGDDTARGRDLMWAFTDPHVHAVWALRGGYGTMRLHDVVDFDVIANAHRSYIGFSDNTYIHLMLYGRGVVSYHGPHPGAEFPAETEAAFLRVLFSADSTGALPVADCDVQPETLRAGVVEGRLVGGNLSLLAAACGTPAQPRTENSILFVEDVGEPAYRIDRCFMQLEMAGVMRGVTGIAFGRFTEVPDDGEAEVRELLGQLAERYQVPAVCNLPFGHVDYNWTIPLGVRALLDANHCSLELLETAAD